MLGTMAGLWLSLFLMVVLGIFAVGALVGKGLEKSADKGDKSILRICLSGDIPEREPSLELIDLLSLDDLGSETLSGMIKAIGLAATDKSIHGMVIECKGSALGIASRGELAEAIKAFKASGKWVYAYADSYTQGDYYVASVADKVWLNPVGMLDVHGLGATTIFFKSLLDKVGVEVQVVKVGSYKSAVEPYIRTSMSEPSREQTRVFLDGIWGHVAGEIAAARGIDEGAVKLMADSLSMTWAPERYSEVGAVDELAYKSDFEAMLREKEELDSDADLPYITPSEYLMQKSIVSLADGDKKHIAVYYAVGDIVDSGEGGIVAEKVVPDIEALANDEKVAGLVLRVNSGGGSAFASEQIWHALEKFKETGRPLYVSMGDYAASGGYYISCGADSIFADSSTLTGSIGIFGLIPNAKKLLNDKIGIDIDVVQTNPNAVFPVITAPMTAQQSAAMQAYVERGYDTFTGRVAEGRGMPVDSVKAIGGGRVWDGMTALKIGLVDELGSLRDAVEAMARATGLDADKAVAYPNSEDEWLNMLLASGLLKTSVPDELKTYATYKKCVDYAKFAATMAPVQARMEPMAIE